MSATYERLKRYYTKVEDLRRSEDQDSYFKAVAKLRAYVAKHPRLAARLSRSIQGGYARGNPVRRRGNLVVVSGPHSHAYPARKTRIKRGNKNPEWGGREVDWVPGARRTVYDEYKGTWTKVGIATALKKYGEFSIKLDAVPLGKLVIGSLVNIGNPRMKRRRNNGMGVSDLVMTPAYGAFGGSIAEGKYNGGPMHWMRRGIRNPKGAPRVNVRKVGPQMWRVSLPSRYVPGDGVPYGIVEKRGDKFFYSGPTSHGDARYPASSLSNAVLKMLSAHASWIGHGTRQRFMEDKRRGNPLVHGYSRKSFGKNVKRERGRGVGKERALAIAFATGRRAAKKAGVRMPKFLRRNPSVVIKKHGSYYYRPRGSRILMEIPGTTFHAAEPIPPGLAARHTGYIQAEGGTIVLYRYKGRVYFGIHTRGNKNPRYRQSPPGAPSLAASRASNWRALTTGFPGASISSVTARGNPRVKTWGLYNAASFFKTKEEALQFIAEARRQSFNAGLRFRVKVQHLGRGYGKMYTVEREGGGLVKTNPRRRKKRNTGEMSFWRATIYSPTGKPIHRQVIQNTRAGAVASARKLARSNPKVALDGPFSSPPAC